MDQTYMLNQWEIARTVDEVAWHLDAKELDKALEAFSEDAELEVIENGLSTLKVSTKLAIKETLAKKMETMDALFHNNGTRMIDVKTLDQNAIACTHCFCQYKQTAPLAKVQECLEYTDKMIKVNDYWYIVSRTIHVVFKSVQ